jgi:hypothetical protein
LVNPVECARNLFDSAYLGDFAHATAAGDEVQGAFNKASSGSGRLNGRPEPSE